MSNNDNFLLTVLGAVGIGALVMGLTQNETNAIEENYDSGMTSFPFQRVRERVMVGKDGCIRAVNFAKPLPGTEKLDKQVREIMSSDSTETQKMVKLNRLNDQGTKASIQRIAQSASMNAQAAGLPAQASLAQAIGGSNLQQVAAKFETYIPESDMGLGAGTVTEPYYVSYPQYNQTIPERSPSLNLGAQIRYNPPSTDRMGITEAYQNTPNNQFCGTQVQSMPPSSSIEHFDLVTENYAADCQSKKQAPFMANINKYTGSNYVADKDSMIKAVANGNSQYADQGPLVIAPLTCEEGCDSTADSLIPLGPEGPDNVMMFERVVTVPMRAGWRQHSPGDVDFIRGDLPVCVDPCQSGWFQSSLKPQFLQQSALSYLGDAKPSVDKYIELQGGNSFSGGSSSGQQFTPYQASIMASPANSSIVQAGALP